MNHLSWLEAIVMGTLQGVSELFPVSSLGHSVLIPAVIGGNWARDLDVAAPESPYLAFIVGTHVATATALLIFYWRDWRRLIVAFFTSLRHRGLTNPDERLIWQLVVGTLTVGLVGLVFEHWVRTTLGRPVPAACFLMINGLMLLWIEWYAARHPENEAVPVAVTGDPAIDGAVADERLSRMSLRRAFAIGSVQTFALAPGISRSGAATAAGMRTGLRREDAVRFSFLLATPVIMAAGVLKIPDLFGPLGDGIRPQVLVGSLCAGIGGYISVRWLTRWVRFNSLRPFGIYCLAAGAFCLVLFAAR